MSVVDSESRRFELNTRPSFSQADLGRTPRQELVFPLFFFTFLVKICAHSERYRNRMAGIFESQIFFGNIASSLASV